MITVIDGSERDNYPELIDEMHRLRARVFRDRLGWEVTVVDGRERDRFDDLSPLYVISTSPQGKVIGSLRALQTTGHTMLGEVFSELLPPGEMVRSPLIWESTRFNIDMDYAAQRGEGAVSQITSELLCALAEVGIAAGLTHIVSVYDTLMERVLKRAGAEPVRLAPPQRIGGVLTVAGTFELNQALLVRFRERGHLPTPSVRTSDLHRLRLAS
jgi:acyl homoserine lactone synthase